MRVSRVILLSLLEELPTAGIYDNQHFTFGSTVSDGDRNEIKSAIAASNQYIGARLPEANLGLGLFTYNSVDEIVNAYGRVVGITSQQGIESIRQRWANRSTAEAGWGAIFVNVASTSWNSPLRPGFLTIAHEYFHIVQGALVGPDIEGQASMTPPDQHRPYGPTWLIEGSAEYFGYHVAHAAGRLSYAAKINEAKQGLSGFLVTLAALEIPSAFHAEGRAYGIAFLAVDFLLRDHGLDGLIAYYKSIGNGASPDAAFQAAFGQTLQQFYVSFAASQ